MKSFIMGHWNSRTSKLGMAAICSAAGAYLTGKATWQQAVIMAVIGVFGILGGDHGK